MSANVRVQVATKQSAGSCALESVAAYAGTLQLSVARINLALRGNQEAPQPVRSGQTSRKDSAPRDSSSIGRHHTQAVARVVRQLFQTLQEWRGKKRIPTVQRRKPMALTSIPGRNKQRDLGKLLQGREDSRWQDPLQSSPGNYRGCEVLPHFTKAERVDVACGVRNGATGTDEYRVKYRVRLRAQAFSRGQRRGEGRESKLSQEVSEKTKSGSAENCPSKERKSSTKEGVPHSCPHPRANWKSAPGLSTQDGTSIRKPIRLHFHRRPYAVKHGSKPRFKPVHFRRIMGDAAKNARIQGCKRREAGNRSCSAIYEPVVLGVWGNRPEVSERANARMSTLRILGLPRHKCGEEYFEAGMQPSGRGCNSGSYDLRSIGFIR